MYVHSSVHFFYFSMCDCALFCEVLTNLSLGAYKFLEALQGLDTVVSRNYGLIGFLPLGFGVGIWR